MKSRKLRPIQWDYRKKSEKVSSTRPSFSMTPTQAIRDLFAWRSWDAHIWIVWIAIHYFSWKTHWESEPPFSICHFRVKNSPPPLVFWFVPLRPTVFFHLETCVCQAVVDIFTWKEVVLLSPPVHVARWALMHRFLSVCHVTISLDNNSYLRNHYS